MKELKDVSSKEAKVEKEEQALYNYDLHTEYLQEEKIKRLDTFMRLSSQKIIYDPVIIHKFIITINKIAKRNNLFNQIPKEPFPSILHFASHMTQFFLDKGVSLEEIKKIDEVIEELENNKVNK